jgi:hypothetical protein
MCCVLLACATTAQADEQVAAFSDAAAQLHVKQLCIKCHNAKKSEGKIRLDVPLVQIDEESWQKIVQVLHHIDMPPKDERQPSKEARSQLEAWAKKHLNADILKRAGDPGAVAWRRLTAIELDNMVRDLTGHAMDASRHFPAENFGGQGFSNIGNVQNSLSGPVLEKYLAMAEEVARHARFDQQGKLVFDPPSAIQSPEVRRDKALSDLKLMARQACGELYLGPGKLIGGEGDERSLDGAFKNGAKAWKGPARYLECLWLAEASKNPQDALLEIANKQNVNINYLRYLWQLRENCPPGSLEESLWVAPLDRLPKARSIDQQIPDDISQACAGIANSVWSCMRQATANSLTQTPSGPYRTVGSGQVHVRLTRRVQQRRENKNFNIMVAPERLAVVVDFVSGSENETTVHLGLPKLQLKEPDRDIFENVDGKRVKKGRNRGESREIVLDKKSLAAMPAGAKWDEYSFSKDTTSPALMLTKPCTLTFDINKVSKQLNRDGGNLDAFLPTSLSDGSGLVQLRHSGNGEVDETALRWATADGNIARWLVASKEKEEALVAEWHVMFRRWFPPHPVTIAPFDGSRNTYGLPDEVQFFRDDARLKTQLLDAAGQQRMDDLWANLFMLSGEPRQRLSIFMGKYRISGLTDEKQIKRLAEIQASTDKDERQSQQRLNHPYGEIPVALPNRLKFYQAQMNQHRLLWRERTLAAVKSFASQAWRRPLTEQEQTRFEQLYDSMHHVVETDVEGVLRTMLMRVLVSPHFLFRCERIASDGKEAPLDPWELATRLSLMIWASLPDEELRQCAADGSLLRDDTLREQTRRMLADPKARGMAEHFFGQWLGFAGFDRSKRGPDVEAFPEFTPQVRRSLHGEAVAFFEDLIRTDRDIRLIVSADYSFLDETLLAYYGGDRLTPGQKEKVRQAKASAADSPINENAFERVEMKTSGRGGVLGMGAILIRNSRTRRTSPVNRGVWVVENLLGRHLPSPPADVPPIPDKVEEGLSLREQMVKHREVKACASCHARIDPFGFAFEAFDATGRLRPKEFRDKIEYESAPDGVKLDGIESLRSYIMQRSEQVNRNLIRRMLGYALNRPVAVIDDPLIERTVGKLSKNEYRLSCVVENIVVSRQFRSHRPATEREFATNE